MKRTHEYLGFRGKTCDIVRLDFEWFDYRNNEDEKDLPNVGAWCRTCARETAKPVHPIYMNGKPAYALRCEKCGGEYAMYKSMFVTRYIGYDTKSGGHINPTHGVKSHIASMDRKAKAYHDSIPKRVEDDMCKAFGYTHEEYREMRKKWDEENIKTRKRIKREDAERHARYEDEKRKEESARRKELIDKGILKYVKNIGLVNTETGEVIKL